MQLLGRTPLPMGSVLICSQKEQYRILSLLGCGGSGLVYRACRVSKQGTEGAVFAVKECFPAPALAFDGSQIQFSRNSAGQILPSEEYGNTELKTHAQAYLQRVAAQLKSENQTLIDLTAKGMPICFVLLGNSASAGYRARKESKARRKTFTLPWRIWRDRVLPSHRWSNAAESSPMGGMVPSGKSLWENLLLFSPRY